MRPMISWPPQTIHLALILCGLSVSAQAQPAPSGGGDNTPGSLDELLDQVRVSGIMDDAETRKREVEFLARKDEQAQLLAEAREREQTLIRRSETLEHLYEANEAKATELEETLRNRMGTLGELFGIVRQVAGDTRAHVHESMVSAELPGREEVLARLAQSKKLPSIEELEHLWFSLQQEMTESGKIVRFDADVIGTDGKVSNREVIRAGVFNAVGDGKYLQWLPEVQKFRVLARQPPARYLNTAADLQAASGGVVRFAIDPSRGSILSLLVQTPEVRERIDHGGVIGYIIIGLGLLTFGLALLRLVYLLFVSLLVKRQHAAPGQIRLDNPLGRVLRVFKDNPHLKPEDLERKADEAVLKESSRLERFLWAVKVVSVVAPLLGLLGTVTGMIRTFQAIQLFGTGDPKMMAGGISEALVTTMLGLIVAVPLVLMHSGIGSIARRVAEILQEQAAGLMVAQATRHPEPAPVELEEIP